MRILAIDTALGACSACVLDAGDPAPLAIEQTAMERGHAEALMPMIERVMAKVEGGFSSLDRVAVTIGPGSYTGLRVGISAARAIAFAAGIPAIGISTLAASAAPFIGREGGRVVAAAVDAKHGQVWFQAMNAQGKQLVSVRQVNHRDAARAIGAGPVSLVGSAALAVANEAWAIGLDALVGRRRQGAGRDLGGAPRHDRRPGKRPAAPALSQGAGNDAAGPRPAAAALEQDAKSGEPVFSQESCSELLESITFCDSGSIRSESS